MELFFLHLSHIYTFLPIVYTLCSVLKAKTARLIIKNVTYNQNQQHFNMRFCLNTIFVLYSTFSLLVLNLSECFSVEPI